MLTAPSYAPRLQKSGYKRATATSVDFMRVTPAAFSAVVVDASSRQRAQRAKVPRSSAVGGRDFGIRMTARPQGKPQSRGSQGLSCAAPQRSFAEVNAFLQVRFGPESRRERFVTACPLCAISGLMHRSKWQLYSITSSARASSEMSRPPLTTGSRQARWSEADIVLSPGRMIPRR